MPSLARGCRLRSTPALPSMASRSALKKLCFLSAAPTGPHPCLARPLHTAHPAATRVVRESGLQTCLEGMGKRPSQPVSRVLSRAIIHLRPASPRTCSGLPESGASRTMGFLFGLAPGGVYLATDCYQPRGALLPHHFTLTRRLSGGMLSVALAVGSRPPGVTWRPALWSPDFPPSAPKDTNSDCPADSDFQTNEVPYR